MSIDQDAIAGTGVQPPRRGALTLLYVEDHADTREVFARLLRAEGYVPLVAQGYAEAVQAAAPLKHLDVVVADLLLPDGDGAELFVQLRERWPELQGVCVSACGMKADVERCRRAGFARHLLKPITFEMLVEALRELNPIPRGV